MPAESRPKTQHNWVFFPISMYHCIIEGKTKQTGDRTHVRQLFLPSCHRPPCHATLFPVVTFLYTRSLTALNTLAKSAHLCEATNICVRQQKD